MSLQNILPYPGIEDVLETHVIEYSVSTSQRFTHQVTVGDAARPFKATLVWMDPTNTMISAKMLINNLDLQVEDPSGTIYYGNGNGGDDVNNVEQVTIAAPTVSGTTYKIRVTSGEYLFGGSQAFSLIVTGGDLTFVSDGVASSGSYDPLGCSSGERLVRVTAMDREADGWGTSQSYRVANSDETVVRTGSMSGADKNDFMTSESWCLPTGSYTAELVNSMDASNFDEMAFEIETCKVYLSQYQPSGQFTIDTSSSNYCGSCPGYEISLLLAGSFYGVPYGWTDNTHYSITQTEGGDDVMMGTLATGMLREHKYCLGDGVYVIQFNDVPTTDDALDDDFLANYFGHEEYTIYLADSSGNSASLYPGRTATVTISGGSGTIKVSGSKDDDDDQVLSTGAIVAIVIVIIIIIGCVGCCLAYMMCRKPKVVESPTNILLSSTSSPKW